MEQKIKLKPKQLEVLNQIQSKKAQLTSLFQDLSAQEGVVLELIIEDAGITEKITSAKIEEGGFLNLTLEDGNELVKPKKTKKITE